MKSLFIHKKKGVMDGEGVLAGRFLYIWAEDLAMVERLSWRLEGQVCVGIEGSKYFGGDLFCAVI